MIFENQNLNLFFFHSSLAASNACRGKGWFSYGGFCYRVESRSRGNWDVAESACRRLGSHVVSLRNDAEINQITQHLPGGYLFRDAVQSFGGIHYL